MVGILQGGDGSRLFGSLPSQTNILLDNIRANTAERFAADKKVIDDAAQARSDAIDRENERYISVKAQINNAAIAVQNGQESADTVRNTLLELRTSIALAGQQGEDADLRAAQFDGQVNSINDEANSMGPLFNLVGAINRNDYTPNQIEYRNSLGASATTLTGTHIGADYRIKASDGTYWIPDLGTDTIVQRSDIQGVIQKTTLSDGTEIEKMASTRNAVKLVSYNEATKDITLEVTFDPSFPPETVTGKLEGDGLGLMPAFFYDGLKTASGRQRAFDAVNKAEVELTSRLTQLTKNAAVVKKDNQRIDDELNRLTQDKTKSMVDQLNETEKLQIKVQQQVQAMYYNLETLSSQQQNYIQAFAGYVKSPFLQISVKA
ncbi:MAG: hypothetical protein JNM81_12425 [Rhodospirillaceae bacterium]|nr:hypothetical protein [Rhodospirillaceae bacterium]